MSINQDFRNIEIRHAIEADAPRVVQLVKELAESGGEHSPIDSAYAADFLHHPGCHVLLAEVEGQTVGLLSYQMRPDLYHGSDTCYIAELIVSGGFRARNVGSALMDNLIERMASLGCVEISVSTMPDNLAAIRVNATQMKQIGLGLPADSVMLFLEQVDYDRNRRPFYLSYEYHVADFCTFTVFRRR